MFRVSSVELSLYGSYILSDPFLFEILIWEWLLIVLIKELKSLKVKPIYILKARFRTFGPLKFNLIIFKD